MTDGRLAAGEALPRDRGGLPAILLFTLAVQALVTWAVLAVAAVAPKVADALGVPVVVIGYQVSLGYAVATGVSLLAGTLVIRWGACRASQLAMLAAAAGALGLAVPSVAAIAVATLAVGFAYGLTNPAAATLLARNTTPANRSFVFSIKQTGVPIGGIAAGLATPAIAVALGWQAAVAAVAPAALLVALALAPFRASWDAGREPGVRLGSDALRGLGWVLSHRELVWLCGYAFVFAALQLSLMTFAVPMAVETLGYGPVTAGALLATVHAAGVAGRLGWGFLADRIGSNRRVLGIVAATVVACCLATTALSADTPRAAVFALAVVFGASSVGWNGVFLSEVVRHVPAERAGTATGVAIFWAFAGVIAGPSLFVSLYALLGGYTAAFGVLAVPALAAGLGILFGPALLARRGGVR